MKSFGLLLLPFIFAACATTDRAPANTPSEQKKADDSCFVSYSQAAGRCNQTAGDTDELFKDCLGLAKSTLKACCVAGQGSTICDQDANATLEQRRIDDQCFVGYSRAAGRCNEISGDNDASFNTCLAPAKQGLVVCCTGGGSSACAEAATN